VTEISKWKYYNHAVIPSVAPHENVDSSLVENGSLWKRWPKAVLVRWTTEFDCGYETGWWYVIKDTPFELSTLKAKRRYEINKGNKNFEVVRIDPQKFKSELYEVQLEAFLGWPEKYRPKVDQSQFLQSVDGWEGNYVYGAFDRADRTLCGYALLTPYDTYMEFHVLRTKPERESRGVNAALVYAILEDNEAFLQNGGYICDGSRSINHETAFQDYLEKYFGFRKAYCNLNIRFKPGVKLVITCLYPFRMWLKRIDEIGIVHKINGLLKMKELSEKWVSINE